MNKKFVTALTAATLTASLFNVSAPVTVKAAERFFINRCYIQMILTPI